MCHQGPALLTSQHDNHHTWAMDEGLALATMSQHDESIHLSPYVGIHGYDGPAVGLEDSLTEHMSMRVSHAAARTDDGDEDEDEDASCCHKCR